MKRVYYVVVALVAILLVYNPINSLLAIIVHRGLPHSIILLVLALLVAAFYRWRQEGLKPFFEAPKAVWLATALLVWTLVSIVYGYASMGEAIRGLNVDFGGLFVFLTIWLLRPSALAARRLYQVMLAGLCLIGTFAIPDIISAVPFETWANYLPIHYVVGKIPQVRSITTGPNPLGTLGTVASFLVVLLWSSGWLTWVCMAIIGLIMGLTYARSAWIGTAAAAGGYFVYTWMRTKRVAVWPIVLALAILIGAASGAVRFHEGIAGVLIHGQSTVEHQQAVTKVAKSTGSESMRDKLLGYGIGMAGPVVLTSPSTLRDIKYHHPYLQPISESWYIQLLQELGVVGIVLFLWLYFEVTRQLFRRNVVLAFLAIGLAINALTLEIWAADANLNILFWAMAALGLYAHSRSEQK